MRQFLNTLFITSEEVYFPLDVENVVIDRGGEAVARYLLHTLQSIVSFSYWCFTGTDGACAKRETGRTFCTQRKGGIPSSLGKCREMYCCGGHGTGL